MTDTTTVRPDVPGWLNVESLPDGLRDELVAHANAAPDLTEITASAERAATLAQGYLTIVRERCGDASRSQNVLSF